jgi:hypothetical protein
MTRRGIVMVELIVAGMVTGTLMVLCLQLCSAALSQRRAADQEQCAMLELGNVMERVAARRWSQLTTAALSDEKLSPAAGRQLPGAELKLEVSPAAKEPNAKRITATLRWQDPSGRLGAPLRLTTWRYKIGE